MNFVTLGRLDAFVLRCGFPVVGVTRGPKPGIESRHPSCQGGIPGRTVRQDYGAWVNIPFTKQDVESFT